MSAPDMPEDWPAQFEGQTRAALIDLLFTMDSEKRDLRRDRDAWRQHRNAVPEAEALAGCIKALDVLKDNGSNHNTQASLERVLDFLRSRFLGASSARIEYVPPTTATGYVTDDMRVGDVALFDLSSGTVTRVQR